MEIQHADDSVFTEKENIPSSESPLEPESAVKISIETPSDETLGPSETSFSTPLLTVKARVKELNHRTGAPGDDSGSLSDRNRSLASSQSSLRGADHKDAKEWMLAASACDLYAMHRMLSGDKQLANYRFPFNGFTALHFAAKANKPECCKFLMDNGGDPDSKTFAGQTPLHLACQYECREAIDYLLKVKGKASHTPDYSGKLPHELIRSRDNFADILYRMSSSGLEKRSSFLGEYPKSLGNQRMAEAVNSATSATTTASSWLSGVRASFRGKSGQPKLKSSSGTGPQLLVPGSQSVGGRVSLLPHHSPGFAVPAPPPSAHHQHQSTPSNPAASILDNLTNAVSSAAHLLGGQHCHRGSASQQNIDGGELPALGKANSKKKSNRLNKMTL